MTAAPRRALSTDQYCSLVERGPTLIRRTGRDGKCDYVNEAWLDFTGIPFEKTAGAGWADSVHPDDLLECLRRQPHRAGGRSVDIEYRLRRHDGLYRYVREHASPFEDPSGGGGFLCCCVDIQETKERGEPSRFFLSMMAHELRTPLSSMRLFLEIMRRAAERGTLSPPENFAKLDAQVDRLNRLVEDLSRSSRASELELELKRLDLGDLVERAVDARRALPESRGNLRHSLLVSGGGPTRWVMADRLRLQQVFEDLLNNAIKFSPMGGTIQIVLRDLDGMHCVSFADPGIGVVPGEVAALTQRFFRGSNASHESYPGLGLGLSFAREIVARHGGRLSFRSELDNGTEATVCLPSCPANGATPSVNRNH